MIGGVALSPPYSIDNQDLRETSVCQALITDPSADSFWEALTPVHTFPACAPRILCFPIGAL